MVAAEVVRPWSRVAGRHSIEDALSLWDMEAGPKTSARGVRHERVSSWIRKYRDRRWKLDL